MAASDSIIIIDDFMDTLESAKRKRLEEEAELNEAKTQKIIQEAGSYEPTITGCREKNGHESDLLKFRFKEEDSFKSKHFEIFSDLADSISSEWAFVCFTEEHKACIFREPNKAKREVFCGITSLTIGDGTSVEVEISSIVGTGERGITFDHFLIPYSVKQLQEAFDSQGVTKVSKIKKRINDETEYDTGSVIVEFNGLVKNLVFRGIELLVTKLALRPMQCTHCGVIGHTKRKCKKINLLLCKKCLQNHDPDQECCNKCINCGLLHHSLNKLCHAIKNEREILEIKEKFNLRYFDAKDLWAKQNKILSNSIVEENSVITNNNVTRLMQTELLNEKQISRKREEQLKLLRLTEAKLRKELSESNEQGSVWRAKLSKAVGHCETWKNTANERKEEIEKLKNENLVLEQKSKEQVSQLTEKFKVESQKTKDDLDVMFKSMELMKVRIKDQDNMVESIGKQLEHQKSVFCEFVNFSDKTIIEYNIFCKANKKKIDAEYLPSTRSKSRKDSS